MKYRVEIKLTNLEGGQITCAERTVSVEREKSLIYPHDPLPIDCDQKSRLIRWAITEATDDIIRWRDNRRSPQGSEND